VRANGAFSQRSLSVFGNPEVSRKADNLGTAKLLKEHLLEQMRRVLQPPKMRKNSGGPEGAKATLSEKSDGVIYYPTSLY